MTKRLAALALSVAAVAAPAQAETIANPVNNYSFPYLSGSLIGGNQTQFVGQTFTAPIAGELTNFQFTLNTSSIQSLYGVVYEWTGTAPGAELWRSANIAGGAGVKDFNPVGVTLTQGQTYVAFLSTFGIADNSGLATVGTCLALAGCGSNNIPNLGTLAYGNVFPDGTITYSTAFNVVYDATFSATIEAAAVPEPASWAMMIGGFGLVGGAVRRRQAVRTAVSFG